MGVDVLVVQHAEKLRVSDDPGLTVRGRHQALLVRDCLMSGPRIAAVWAGPLRRARETALPLAEALGQQILIDPRLTERMNWHQDALSFDAFLVEWQRASDDRSYEPPIGDSSNEAGARFIEAIREIAEGSPDRSVIAVVSHGGVTVDTLRTLVGDEALTDQCPGLILNGVPSSAVTRMVVEGRTVAVVDLPSTTHLTDTTSHRPA